MAETTEEQNTQQTVYTLDANSKLAKRIDTLFFKWFDKNTYTLIGNKDEQFDTTETLNELTKIVNNLLTQLTSSKEKTAVELLNNLNSFLAGDSTAGVTLIGDRPQEDHVSKLIWLINVATTVSVLSGELAETKKTLDVGPMKKAHVSAENIEKVIPAVKNSKQMKTPADFIGKELPSKFTAVAKHKFLAKAAERRSRFTGAARPGEPHTIEQMYYDIGEALIFVSTGIFAEANRAFTNQGQRLAADKIKNLDISKLAPKEQDKLMQTMYNGFQNYSNYTAELSIFSSINDKMILDSALAVWYRQLNDEQKERSGFVEQDLYSLPKAIAFSRKFKSQFDSMYIRYTNRFVDGITAALKKEQETVEKDWFENKITGERQYRRGRLAGHGNKFMHTAPMKWLNDSLGKKSWASLWAIPKLGMLTLNIMTNPTLRKMRKKLTGTLFAGLRSFAQGVAEGFTATGRSTEITYEDVIKKLKEAEEKLKKIDNENTYVANESAEFADLDLLLEANDMFTHFDDENEQESEEFDEEKDKKYAAEYTKILKALAYVNKNLGNRAVSDESTENIRNAYKVKHDKVEAAMDKYNIRTLVNSLQDSNEADYTPSQQVLAQIAGQLQQFDDDYAEFSQKDYSPDARDAVQGGTLQVGEKTVAICEDVFDTLNKYIARQWNLLAAHSNHADMPLCVDYTKIELKDYVKAAAQKQITSEMTFTEWTEFNKLFEANLDNKMTQDQKNRKDSLASVPNDEKSQKEIATDRSMRDVRDNVNNNNGQTTAQYPKKLTNGMYQYHGLEIKAASSDNSKTGFGVFADRLIKIAGPVDDFCKFVDSMGHDDSKKTFNNDAKDGYVTPARTQGQKQSNANIKASNVNPLESVFVTGFILNEDIGNKLVQATDKATDAVGNAAKSGIKWLGKGAGKGIGKVLHGITHTGTEDKDALMAKTGLTYLYDRTLNTTYIIDGANILKKHCLTKSAEASFEAIGVLARALKESDIANARSISAVVTSLNTFKEAIGQTKFSPCKSIIDYELADKINKGGISDDPTTGACMIKGICIRNFDSAKTYSSGFSDKDIFAINKEDEQEMQTLSGETQETPVNNEPAQNEQPAEQPAEQTAEQPAQAAQQTTDDKTAKAAANDLDKAEVDKDQMAANVDRKQNAQITNGETPNYNVSDTYQLKDQDAKKLAKTYTADEWKNMNSKQRKDAVKSCAYVDGKPAKRANLAAENVDVSKLSAMLSEINKIDWKELNG